MLFLANDICETLSLYTVVNRLLFLLQLVHLFVIELFMQSLQRIPQGLQAVRRLDLGVDLFLNVSYLAIDSLEVISDGFLNSLLEHTRLQLINFI